MRPGLLALLAMLAACAMLSACAVLSPHPRGSGEILDEQSGNTLFVVTAPLVFARGRLDVAAHARDYATLVAVEVDVSGRYRDYFLLYRWSTVDKRMTPPPDADEGELRILAGGRVIELKPLAELPVSLARREELHVPDHADIVAHAYDVDLATLRFIASSHDLSLQMPQESLAVPFQPWSNGREARKALTQFIRRAGESQ